MKSLNFLTVVCPQPALSTRAFKMLAGITLGCLISASTALAAQGGFNGPGAYAQLVSVAQVEHLHDDAGVVLRGHILQRMNGDEYLFADASGRITVDIDKKVWNGMQISPESLVELHGETDRDWNSLEVEVKFIRLLTEPHTVVK